MNKKITWGNSPGIIFEDVYYFEKLDLKRGFFTVGVWQEAIVRADQRNKALLGSPIDKVIETYEKRKYEIHKV